MTIEFDPNAKTSSKDGIYGLPFTEESAKVVFIPIPWDVTTSYMAGTAKGPKAIREASDQIDLYDLEYKDIYKKGLFMQKEKSWIKTLNKNTRKIAETIIEASDEEIETSKTLKKNLEKVNKASKKLNDFVEDECDRLLEQGKIPVVVGGDHSVPYGAMKSYAKKYKDFGILHIDAHSDTRVAYMGFEHSHASVLYNVSKDVKSIKKIVQVGIRDFCEDEYKYTKKSKKFDVFYDLDLQKEKMKGKNFISIAKKIISKLPKNVYISFDIDGLDPRFCPNTGTPVPGGLDYNEVVVLISELLKSKRKLVGFDLVEVCPSGKKGDEWDANVGMRLLYKLSLAAMKSNK